MIFTESGELRSLERMMTGVPKFQSRGHGVVIVNRYKLTAADCDCRLCPDRVRGRCIHDHCPCFGERLSVGAVPLRELMQETMYELKHIPFFNRLNEMIAERRNDKMTFKNELHKKLFQNAIEKKDQHNTKLMSALFLLTANLRLWNYAHKFVNGNSIDFDNMKPTELNELGYTVFCAAKDLYTGSKHFSVSDLADRELISPVQFSLICFAMAIRRFGLDALKFTEASK